ncbi:hypothetical protein GUITHDRAFT_162457 [Guillardia theta CCMP2712]|uniref:RCC1-like domain-containing protein n=1 Tax=Guillardia theta (strain CCMP2712) TaxID=905079 RepID=L1JJS5_GUITC|nr:hypothetical protein GUITHDRAFT_162457 [Guillardia theta CCMP2712]EKX48320.1 hypothetical protein GUITHDRAFT_162457 [Guillardia theta CCMP2712]|eukprot:XP_005835300.1 hypothetical protein GUITHDRAFT_162457 [Guillardia theta CCMP2712]
MGHGSLMAEGERLRRELEDGGKRTSLQGWGEFGRLGHGDTLSQLEPKRLRFDKRFPVSLSFTALAHESLNGAIYVACGGHHTVAVTEDGEVVSWGWGNEGQLGSGNAFDQTVPAVVKALSNHRVCGVACGYYHTAVVTDVGLVMCWGKGNSGQLGQGDWTSSLLPRTVSTLYNEKIRQIACGMAHTLALSVNGEIYSWGAGADGQLGVGKHQEETADVATPQKVRVDEEEKFEFIACGSRHCMAITDDCRLFSWGLGADGRLGLGDSESRFSPTVVRRSIENLRICYVAAGGHHTAVLSDNGEIFTCGRGSYGQLGHGDADPQLTLKKARALRHGCLLLHIVQLRDKKIIKAACGDTHTLVISTAGEVFAWGAAEDGQLGTGGTEGANSPVELTSLRGLVGDVSCGLVHSAAVPMQIFAVSSKIAELEDVIQRLSTSLRTAEMQVQAERRSRLVAEHKLQEAMHLLSKRGAVHKVVHGSEATGNGEEEHRNHAVRHEAPPMVDACVQTEGYLLYPRKSYAKSSVATAEPVAPPAGNQDDRASSRQGEGERKKERESEKEGERKKTGEGTGCSDELSRSSR